MAANVLQHHGLAHPVLLHQARQHILKRLNAMYRLGHGFIAQEVLEELQTLLRAVEGNLVPRTSYSHQCQTLVHLAPSTNLCKIHMVLQHNKSCFENKIYHCCCSSDTLTLTSLPSYQGYQFVTVDRESASMEYLVPVRGTTESASPLPDNMSNVRD